MSYAKTSPVPPGLNPGETAVTLDDGSIIAVQAVSSVQDTSGCPVITATARAINADGTPKTMADGSPIASTFNHTSCTQEITDAGGIAAVQKCVLMAVLGEQVVTDMGTATVTSLALVGPRPVTRAHLGGVSYAAGADPYRRIYSHNIAGPKP